MCDGDLRVVDGEYGYGASVEAVRSGLGSGRGDCLYSLFVVVKSFFFGRRVRNQGSCLPGLLELRHAKGTKTRSSIHGGRSKE